MEQGVELEVKIRQMVSDGALALAQAMITFNDISEIMAEQNYQDSQLTDGIKKLREGLTLITQSQE